MGELKVISNSLNKILHSISIPLRYWIMKFDANILWRTRAEAWLVMTISTAIAQVSYLLKVVIKLILFCFFALVWPGERWQYHDRGSHGEYHWCVDLICIIICRIHANVQMYYYYYLIISYSHVVRRSRPIPWLFIASFVSERIVWKVI